MWGQAALLVAVTLIAGSAAAASGHFGRLNGSQHLPLAAPMDSLLGGLSWQELPELPEPHGLAGAFAGASGGALLVAGGSNFPAGRPWQGAQKAWHRDVFVLPRRDAAEWVWLADALPWEAAYGVSASYGGSLFLAGGGNATAHSDHVWELTWAENALKVRERARLPAPLAFSQGALLGDQLYMAGGLSSPAAAAPLTELWRLDLSTPGARWEVLEPPPGQPRMLAAAGSHGDGFYLIGGTDLSPQAPGGRVPLLDAWRYREASGWARLRDLPRAAVAAPSPLSPLGPSGLLLLGGDDGRYYGTALSQSDDHPGFLDDVLLYDTETGSWEHHGRLPKHLGPDPAKHPEMGVWPPVTASTALWAGGVALPCGEVRPGVRTRRVLWAALSEA